MGPLGVDAVDRSAMRIPVDLESSSYRHDAGIQRAVGSIIVFNITACLSMNLMAAVLERWKSAEFGSWPSSYPAIFSSTPTPFNRVKLVNSLQLPNSNVELQQSTIDGIKPRH